MSQIMQSQRIVLLLQMKVIETSWGRGEGVQRPEIKNCKGVWVEGGGGVMSQNQKKKLVRGSMNIFWQLPENCILWYSACKT